MGSAHSEKFWVFQRELTNNCGAADHSRTVQICGVDPWTSEPSPALLSPCSELDSYMDDDLWLGAQWHGADAQRDQGIIDVPRQVPLLEVIIRVTKSCFTFITANELAAEKHRYSWLGIQMQSVDLGRICSPQNLKVLLWMCCMLCQGLEKTQLWPIGPYPFRGIFLPALVLWTPVSAIWSDLPESWAHQTARMRRD